ncbi:MAG: hypothetical protein K2M19_03850 [Muribaculaceae bacterium]|nr:hypothetical protein [Muribaculaceae bacterium]
MNIVFLDFDGVMDTVAYDMYLVKNGLPECDDKGRPVFDPECIECLRIIIAETNADVVVTSDWKYIDKYEGLLQMWKDRNMPGFLTDVTPNVSKHRGDEIDLWLKECKIDCNYVIIDDLDESNFNFHQLERLIVVNPAVGLDHNAAERAISILNRPLA